MTIPEATDTRTDVPDEFLTFTGDDITRFWAKVDKQGLDECWPWLPPCAPYGHFWLGGTNVSAHRVACTLGHGSGAGLMALHSCDNPPCCNPAHLRWGTTVENVGDRVERSRSARGATQGLARLTENDVRAIRQRAEAGERKASLARQFGVTKQTIALIVTRRTWKHV